MVFVANMGKMLLEQQQEVQEGLLYRLVEQLQKGKVEPGLEPREKRNGLPLSPRRSFLVKAFAILFIRISSPSVL